MERLAQDLDGTFAGRHALVSTTTDPVSEVLWRDGELVLTRERLGDPTGTILCLAPSVDRPSTATLDRLRREASLASELDPRWATVPIGLREDGERLRLLMSDPGGLPAHRPPGERFDIGAFLRVAIGASAALGQVHEANLTHGDIKPSHILVDDAFQVRLTGFGLATTLPRERPALVAPKRLAGSLPYMAPEQTGRMNRSVDFRSDLYSLGTAFYRMLTGELPFQAKDPMEWIHSHIARQPLPPAQRVPEIPLALSQIIMRLLAKAAEDRYQSASGLEEDLRLCLRHWDAKGEIPPFELGAADAAARLLVPERLYGREDDVQRLLGAFDHVLQSGRTALVLVSGPAGIGKSSVVNEIHKALVAHRGLFAAGKYSPDQRDTPYSTLAHAFRELIRELLSGSDAEIERWRASLAEALGPNGQLIVNLVPELAALIGDQPTVPELPPQEALHRFKLVFARFVSVFARKEHPLALFIDDLQWLDRATIDALEFLLTDRAVQHLLVIGAHRDHEVTSSHPLTAFTASLRAGGAELREIRLTPLAPRDVSNLVTDTLRCTHEVAEPLSSLIHRKTAGNPFFVIQFLTSLVDEGILRFHGGRSGWGWKLDPVAGAGLTDDVLELMMQRLARLPPEAQSAIRQLAAFGATAEIVTLAGIRGERSSSTIGALREALQAGLLTATKDTVSFLHDRVQEAAYALIPKADRAALHLQIGRFLEARQAETGAPHRVFEVVNHLNRARPLLGADDERRSLARLNLLAGLSARATAAYASALAYFDGASSMLPAGSWRSDYRLTFDVELNLAACEFLTGDRRAERRLRRLHRRARTIVDVAAAICQLQVLLTMTDRLDESIEASLDYMRRIGARWSANPSDADVAEEYDQLWKDLGGRPISSIGELPAMKDAESLATVAVLTECAPAAYYRNMNLFCIVVARIARVSLKSGNDHCSAYAYVLLGVLLGPKFDKFDAATEFGEVALRLVDKPGHERFRPRVYHNYGYCVNAWRQHIATGRTFLRRAIAEARENGDFQFAAYTYYCLITDLIAAGDALESARSEADRGIAFAQERDFALVVDILKAHRGLIRSLTGDTAPFGSFDGDDFDERSHEERLERGSCPPNPACIYWIRKLQARYFAGRYADAVEAAAKAKALLWSLPASFEMAEYSFYAALTHAALHDGADGEARSDHHAELLSHHRRTSEWALRCPANFDSRRYILAAEIDRIEGRVADSLRAFERAIQSADQHGLVQNKALAFERASVACRQWGLTHIADTCEQMAGESYARWGAHGKVRQLEASRARPILRVAGEHATAAGPQLDMAALVKATQAISSEVVLSRLVEALMRITVENAGAERGVLVLLNDGSPSLAAEAVVSGGEVAVSLCQADPWPELPRSVIEIVTRTKATFIADEASTNGSIRSDPYVRARSSRSILCLPILSQSRLLGYIYLENGLISHVFDAERARIIPLIVAQAAISLENADLYSSLRRSEAILKEGQRLSQTGSWVYDVATRGLTWSEEHYRILNLDPGLNAKPDLGLFLSLVHPDDRLWCTSAFEAALQHGTSFQIEFRVRCPDGALKDVQSIGRPIARGDGSVREFIGTLIDITERKRGEQRLQEAQAALAHVNRVATLGELAASIAHEVNSPLAASITNSEVALRWLNRRTPEIGEATAAIERSIKDAWLAADVVARVRTLARKQGPTLQPVALDEVVTELMPLLRHELTRREVNLRFSVGAEDPVVLGDKVQLQQVVTNLVLNAAQATEARRAAGREVDLAILDGEDGTLLLRVQDNGDGIKPEDEPKVFDTFFSTKPDGMGMGLAICRSIVQAHEGRIWFRSSVGEGAAFFVALASAASGQTQPTASGVMSAQLGVLSADHPDRLGSGSVAG